MPVIYLSTGVQPVKGNTTNFAFYFLPYIFILLYLMYKASDGALTFRAFSFSFSSFELQLKALFSILTGKKIAFDVTPKNKQEGNYAFIAYPHVFYIILFFLTFGIALIREGLTPG